MRKLATGLLSMQASNVPGSENVEVSEFKEEDAESANKSGFNTMEVDGFENLDHSGEAVLASNKFFNYRIGYEMKKELIKLNHALNGIGYKNLIKISSESLYNFLLNKAGGEKYSNQDLQAGMYYFNNLCIIKCLIQYKESSFDDTECRVKVVDIFDGEEVNLPNDTLFGRGVGLVRKGDEVDLEDDDGESKAWYALPGQNSIGSELLQKIKSGAASSSFTEPKPEVASVVVENKYPGKYNKIYTFFDKNSEIKYVYFDKKNKVKVFDEESNSWLELPDGDPYYSVVDSKLNSMTEYASIKMDKSGFFIGKKIVKNASPLTVSPILGGTVVPTASPTATPAPATPAAATPAAAAGAGASTTPVVKKVVIPKGMYHKWYQDSWGYYWPQDKDVVLVYKKDADGKADFSERGQQHVSTAYKNWNKFVGKLIKLTEISDPRPATPAATPAAATPAATPAAATPAASSSPVQPTAGGTVTTTVNGKEAVSIGAFGHDELFLIVESVSTGNPEIFLYDANKRVYSKMGDDQIGRWRKSLSRREINYLSKALEGKLSPKQIEGFKRFMNLSRRDSWLPFGDKKIKERMFDAQRDMKSTSARQNRLDKLEKKGVI